MRVLDIAVIENTEPNPAVVVDPSPLIALGAVARTRSDLRVRPGHPAGRQTMRPVRDVRHVTRAGHGYPRLIPCRAVGA
jgi:hypothetical protein